MSSCGIITHYIFSIAFLQKKKTAHVEVVVFYAEVVMRISPVATSLRLIQQTILPHKKVSLLKSKVYHEVLIDHFKHFLELIVSLDDAKSTKGPIKLEADKIKPEPLEPFMPWSKDR